MIPIFTTTKYTIDNGKLPCIQTTEHGPASAPVSTAIRILVSLPPPTGPNYSRTPHLFRFYSQKKYATWRPIAHVSICQPNFQKEVNSQQIRAIIPNKRSNPSFGPSSQKIYPGPRSSIAACSRGILPLCLKTAANKDVFFEHTLKKKRKKYRPDGLIYIMINSTAQGSFFFLAGCYSVLVLHHFSRFLFLFRERGHLYLSLLAFGLLAGEVTALLRHNYSGYESTFLALELFFLAIALMALFRYTMSSHRTTGGSCRLSAWAWASAGTALAYHLFFLPAAFSPPHYLVFIPALCALFIVLPRAMKKNLHAAGGAAGLAIFLTMTTFTLRGFFSSTTENPVALSLLPYFIFETLALARRSAKARLSLITLSQKLRRMHKRQQRAAMALNEARMYAFQDRLNPHFLFNALNTLRSLIVYNPEVAENVLLQLAGLYRGILRSFSEAVIPITDEIEMLDNYLALESQRFMGYIHIEKHFTRLSETLLVPPLTFQPLVENAFKHGRVHEKPDGRICVSVRTWHDGFIFVVSDNGIGINSASISKGTTVTSIEDRLAHYYAFARLRIRTNRRARKTTATLVCHSRRNTLATSASGRSLSSLITA